jgi:hypothetical protein
MASFAIDGGTLIVGIAEDKDNRLLPSPLSPSRGLAEKMEQVARSIPDPPLNVVTQEVESSAERPSQSGSRPISSCQVSGPTTPSCLRPTTP